MDKLRAMEYLSRVVEAGSLAAAARDLGVNAPAVTKMIAALERSLGTQLLRRSSRHLSLTAVGEAFLPACMRALDELRAAEAALAVNRHRASGTLVMGMPQMVGQHLVAPHLPAFLSRHPDLTIDARIVNYPSDAAAALADVLVVVGWPNASGMVMKRLAQLRFITAAAPAYWRAHGVPQDPAHLAQHTCFTSRTPAGVVLDVWKYQRGDQLRNVQIKPRLIGEDREWHVQAGLQGLGVIRTVDLLAKPLCDQGLLQPVLEDWESLEVPPVSVLYRRRARSTVRVRARVYFLVELFAGLEEQGRGAHHAKLAPVPMPAWWRSKWSGALSRRGREAGRR